MPVVNRPQPSAPNHSLIVRIDGVAVDYAAIERVDISLKANEHDLAVVILAGISPLSVTDYVDRPISVEVEVPYGQGFTFCGYINHVNPSHKAASGQVNFSLFQEATIYCLGASSVMRGKKNRVWNEVTVLDMVSDFSREYNLSYSCPNTSPTLPRLVQRGVSDWAALSRACVQSGLSVNVHGTEIHVWNPVQSIRYGAPAANLITVADAEAYVSGPGRIMEFDASIGTSHAYGDVNEESLALLDDTGKLLTAKSTDLLGTPRYGTDMVSGVTDVLPVEARSMKDARRKLQATLAYADAFVASVTTSGVAGPLPGSAIRIDGFNSEFDGVWLVRELDMRFNRGHFLTDFKIGRNTKGDDYTGHDKLNSYSPPPKSNLQNDKWRAALRRERVYSSN
jgi:phage protein D